MSAHLNNLLDRYQKGFSLEQAFYVDPLVLNAEFKAIWRKHWIYAGNCAQVKNTGDFFILQVDKDEIIIIRDDDGKLYAHHNTCTHRGSALCSETSGNTAKLICPYHQWVFNKNGKLFKARMMPDDFCKDHYNLHSVLLNEIAGLIFICLNKEPPSFDPIQTALEPYLIPFQFNQSKIAALKTFTLNANWKLVAENFRECYHCGGAHPEYCNAVIGASLTEETRTLTEKKHQEWTGKGLTTVLVEPDQTTTSYTVRYPLRPGIESYTVDGKKASLPMGTHTDHDAGVVGLVNYPNFWFDAVSDYAWIMRITPIDPAHTQVEFCWLVNQHAQEGKDYNLGHLLKFWEVTGEQDGILCENNFKGICSSSYQPGLYAPVEDQVINFVDWCVSQLRKGQKQE